MKIGFVDYYLSEWHANNYPAWIREIAPDCEIAYAWAELDASPRDGVTSEEWCKNNGAVLCETLEELCEKSDVILILAPTDPDRHLPYAKVVLPYGKRAYIDKTFAPNLEEAEEIFALAAQYKTPFFSTSALRFAEELDAYGECSMMMTTGGGIDLAEYIIHQAEMVVRKMGMDISRVCAHRFAGSFNFQIAYENGKEAMITFNSSLSFFVTMSDGKKAMTSKVTSPFFQNLMADIVRFYREGTVSFDPKETLAVMRLRDALLAATKAPDTWVELK